MVPSPSIPNVQGSQHKRVTVHNSHGQELVGVLHETNSLELVIICHGFRSSKDRIPMVNLGASFEKEGISAFRFDFAGNGESEGYFQYGNYRREADDLRAIVEHFHQEERFIVAIVGHSKGGNAVLLYASRYKDVQTVINISGRFNLESGIEGRLGRDFKEKIKQDGFIDVRNRKGRVEYRVTEESLMDRLTTDTRGACQSIPNSCRVLTIHSSMDETVPVEDAMEFAKNVPNHKLQIIEGADHEFTLHQDELALVVVAFVKAGLCGDYMAIPSQSCKRTSGYIHSRF
ncbi:hypothetical protein RND71_014147 [Anisodus tanguticus]|uniref:Serine aminopeptidase S33 domain-containing protein n=1 Tax=Anisodus tanguticus TaxID=243964 RepID=A0AAE1SAU6_9SOLA|nr:hypothetical protein RND71_014147 [Anisodus tanguticus]